MRFDGGWIKLYREAWGKDLSQNVYLWAIWHALLSMATWKESQIIWNGRRRILPPGSVVFGVGEFADKWGCSRQTVWKWLQYLNDAGCIAYEASTRGSLATICNWDKYQHAQDDALTRSEHGVNHTQTPGERQVALNEEVKKERSNTYDSIFDATWQRMPTGVKQSAYKAWSKYIPPSKQKDFECALSNYLAYCAANDRFKKDMSSFIGSDKTVHPWVDWINPTPTGKPLQPMYFDPVTKTFNKTQTQEKKNEG